MFGVTADGHSVLAHVNGFLPYFWVPAPPGFQNAECKELLATLNVRILSPFQGISSHALDDSRT